MPPFLQANHIAWTYDQEHLYGNYMPVNYNIYPQYRGGNTSDVSSRTPVFHGREDPSPAIMVQGHE